MMEIGVILGFEVDGDEGGVAIYWLKLYWWVLWWGFSNLVKLLD